MWTLSGHIKDSNNIKHNLARLSIDARNEDTAFRPAKKYVPGRVKSKIMIDMLNYLHLNGAIDRAELRQHLQRQRYDTNTRITKYVNSSIAGARSKDIISCNENIVSINKNFVELKGIDWWYK